ncbi:MAG TPA: hypothetical protein VMD91_12700 [Candidatus Sulfotelmatobacter sp.]|nr:hypothetical protein [Candidatus Sulfotelmatobacter sp.]
MVTLTIGGQATTLAQAPLTGYSGQPLYFHVQSNGQTLSIVIDDKPRGSSVLKPPAAATADVTFMLNGAVVEHWPAVAANYTAVNGLNFSASLDPLLQTLALSVDDNPQAATQNTGALEYVLVKSAAGQWQIKWLELAPEVDLNTTGLSNVDLIPAPPPTGQIGGVYGPMGFAVS